MVNSLYEIKKFLDQYRKNGDHPQNPIIRFYTDQFLSGEINSQKLYRLLEDTGLFQPEINVIKTHQNDQVDNLNSDDELRKIIRKEIYQNAIHKEEINKNYPQSRIRSGGKKRKRKRSNISTLKKIVNDDIKTKRDAEVRDALFTEFDEKNKKEMELSLKSKMGSNISENFPIIPNPLSPEEKVALHESDQYRIEVSDKQKRYWGSF